MRRYLLIPATIIVALIAGAACVPPPPPPPPPTTTTAPGHPVIFADEFNGPGLDLSKWQPNWLGPNNATVTKPIAGSEISCYDPAQVSVPGDGYLHLTATQRSCTANDGRTYGWASGIVESLPHFTVNGPYRIEARVCFPGTNGTVYNWPAFWIDGSGTWPSTGEADIAEGLSGHVQSHVHVPSGSPGLNPGGDWTGCHVYSASVSSSGATTFFYDGNDIGTLQDVHAPHYIIFDYGVGGYGGPSVAGTMTVDYVRVYAG